MKKTTHWTALNKWASAHCENIIWIIFVWVEHNATILIQKVLIQIGSIQIQIANQISNQYKERKEKKRNYGNVSIMEWTQLNIPDDI